MVQINFAQKSVTVKIVYYGPGMSGKTTNLEVVHQKAPDESRGDLTSISTDGDRTLFFDFMPLDLGTVAGMKTQFQIYTVPGQVYYNSTRKLVLQGVDGVIFIADSSASMMEENKESLRNLQDNLAEYGKGLNEIPIVIQYNKRDLPDALPVEVLQAELNPHGWPSFEGIASSGQGVFPTLKGLAATVLDTIHEQTGGAGSRSLPQTSQPATSGPTGLPAATPVPPAPVAQAAPAAPVAPAAPEAPRAPVPSAQPAPAAPTFSAPAPVEASQPAPNQGGFQAPNAGGFAAPSPGAGPAPTPAPSMAQPGFGTPAPAAPPAPVTPPSLSQTGFHQPSPDGTPPSLAQTGFHASPVPMAPPAQPQAPPAGGQAGFQAPPAAPGAPAASPLGQTGFHSAPIAPLRAPGAAPEAFGQAAQPGMAAPAPQAPPSQPGAPAAPPAWGGQQPQPQMQQPVPQAPPAMAEPPADAPPSLRMAAPPAGGLGGGLPSVPPAPIAAAPAAPTGAPAPTMSHAAPSRPAPQATRLKPRTSAPAPTPKSSKGPMTTILFVVVALAVGVVIGGLAFNLF